jgi:hypothetical protein
MGSTRVDAVALTWSPVAIAELFSAGDAEEATGTRRGSRTGEGERFPETPEPVRRWPACMPPPRYPPGTS